ncbi:hypothetical protein BDN70DRAFT_871456 [Pholiota conissans]|uniref:Transcription initiation factor TFIID subunit 8 n=1 Tax=Pholiota conissans TaxID=109636 RepID=A0A9P5ZEA5_9AGAR|nr:hypothetical protein BDN70DRAFT_871456 [Pholiota conissans]
MYQPDAVSSPYTPLYTGHYPNQYPATSATIPTTIPYFPPYHAQQPAKPTEISPPDPSEPSVTPEVASLAMQRLVLNELRNAGFERAAHPAVQRLEKEVAIFVQQLFQRAHEYANLSNRAGPIASDVLLACEEFDMPPQELYRLKKTLKRKRGKERPVLAKPATLISLPSRSPSPELLASDDEDNNVPSTIPTTLRNLPPYFPNLPPKHTYLQTPASPPKKAALPSLEKKLKTAALVQESLQHLLLATEDSMNHEEGELLGHVVNWEMNVHPRKRWKVGAK